MEVTREIVKKKGKREVLQSLHPGKYSLKSDILNSAIYR
jgi:hypothetical protein